MLSISRPYMQDDVTWCVANARPRDLWSNIFQIFTANSGIAIATTTIIVAFFLKQLLRTERKYENYVWTFMLTIAATFGHSLSYEPSRISIRVMMTFLFLYGLIITTSFSAFSISFLTQPRLKYQIDDLPDAVQAGFKFSGGNDAYSHLDASDDPVIWLAFNIFV